PYAINCEGRGPAWSNSLFEDNAEYGFGHRIAIDQQTHFARELLRKLAPQIGDTLVSELLDARQSTETEIAAQRARVQELLRRLPEIPLPDARHLHALAGALVKKSVWIVGGDGWAY